MLHFVFANKASGSTTDLTCSEQARRAAPAVGQLEGSMSRA
jgi:hypothetical protein